jgi:hypothetical protein
MITGVSYGQYLNPPRSIATPETACIVAEIAERLSELEEKRRFAASDLVQKLAAVATISPRMFRHVTRLLHGDTLHVLESFSIQASRRGLPEGNMLTSTKGLTKQMVHCEWQAELVRVRNIFPDVAAILQQLREQADNHDAMTMPTLGPNRAEDEDGEL